MKKRLWRKVDISLMYRSWAAVVIELQLVQLCLSVRLCIIESLTKKTEAELERWDITETVGKAIDGKVPLIDSWYPPGRPWDNRGRFVCVDGGVSASMHLCLFESTDVCVQSDEQNATRWQRPYGSAGMSVGDWHIVEFFSSNGGDRLGLVFKCVIWWNWNKSGILSFSMKKPGGF